MSGMFAIASACCWRERVLSPCAQAHACALRWSALIAAAASDARRAMPDRPPHRRWPMTLITSSARPPNPEVLAAPLMGFLKYSLPAAATVSRRNAAASPELPSCCQGPAVSWSAISASHTARSIPWASDTVSACRSRIQSISSSSIARRRRPLTSSAYCAAVPAGRLRSAMSARRSSSHSAKLQHSSPWPMYSRSVARYSWRRASSLAPPMRVSDSAIVSRRAAMMPFCSYQVFTFALTYRVSSSYGVVVVIAGWGRYRFGAPQSRSNRSQFSVAWG